MQIKFTYSKVRIYISLHILRNSSSTFDKFFS